MISNLPINNDVRAVKIPVSLMPYLVLFPLLYGYLINNTWENSVFPFLPFSSVLPPNIAHAMEWNSKEIQGNSFFWNSFPFGVVPSSCVSRG